jgi:isoleucyl-tRNA synthetase
MIDRTSHPIQANEVEIIAEDVPGWSVASRGPLTTALDISLTPALEEEGLAREFVNRVQKIRKDDGYEVTDRIHVKVSDSEKTKPAILSYKDYICAEILANNIEIVPDLTDGIVIDIEGTSINIFISKN